MQIASKEEEAVWRETVAPASEVMNISMDGAMVNIRGEGWKEVNWLPFQLYAICGMR